MKKLTTQEVQQVALELLIEFDKICNEQMLRYSLGGGTLLGAVRHKGYIPWDDDIDVMMPRPDYEKFKRYCENNITNFDYFSNETNPDYFELFIRISNKETLVNDLNTDIEFSIGVSLDIFPIDGLGSKALKNYNKTKFKRELLNATKWKRYFRSKSRPIWIEPIRIMFFILSRFVNKQNLYNNIEFQIKENDFSNSLFAGCISGVYREKEIMQKTVFENYMLLEFEGRFFSCIKDYDSYLRCHYGNYMELPSKENQVAHYNSSFYWKG